MTEGRSAEGAPDAGAKTTDYALLAALRSLGDQFGPLGVALAAAELTDTAALVRRLTEADEESPLPEGIYGRIELPGYRNHTGWVTEETRFGVQMAVVRDWDGRVVAEVAPGPLCQFVHLPTPLKRPDPQEQAAITSGAGGSDDYLWERE